jgi:hypothetical protein
MMTMTGVRTAREILERRAAETGWTTEEQRELLCRFLDEYGLAGELDERLAGRILAAKLSDAALDPECLDELVHEAASQDASGVNNDGCDEQLRFLIAHWGVEETGKAIRQVLDGTTEREEPDDDARAENVHVRSDE